MFILIRNLSLFIILVFVIAACSSGRVSKYEASYPLTSKTAQSLTTDLTMQIPQNWFTAVDNECNCIDLWLIADDYSASLNLFVFNIDDEMKKKISGSENELYELVKMSKMLKRARFGGEFKTINEDEYFTYDNTLKAGAYVYRDGTLHEKRVVLFKHKGRYYEFLATPQNDVTTLDITNLFTVQNSVLYSVK